MVTTTALPRGIRNQNPGNIRKTKIAWKGKVPSPDGEFEQFISPEMGIRAIAKDILTGYRRGDDTVAKIIAAWAPPSENNTAAYVKTVAAHVGVLPDQVIDVDSWAIMRPLVEAIIRVENGDPSKYGRARWYEPEVIRRALFDAGVYGTPGETARTSVEAKGAVATAASTGAVGAIEAAYDALDKLEPIKATLIEIAPAVSAVKYLLLALSVAGAALVIYGLMQKFRKGLA